MALVSLREQGFIYEDDFSTGISSRWEITPNVLNVEHDGTNLNINPNSSRVGMFLRELTDIKEFVFDMKNIYNPTTVEDIGGLIAFADENDFVSLDEYFDTEKGTAETYPWIRLVRKHNNYFAYWSNNGVDWEIIGTSTLDRLSPKIGMFLEGGATAPMTVEKVVVTKSNIVTVGNLQENIKVTLVGSDGKVHDVQTCRNKQNKVTFDVSNLPTPFQGKFIVDTGIEVMDDSNLMNIYGGDVYHFEVSPSLVFHKDDKDIRLDNGVEELLGYLKAGHAEEDCKITVSNPYTGDFSDVLISLVSYMGTDHWYRLVDIANDFGGVPGIWSSTVNLSDLPSGTEKTVWVKLKREYAASNFGTDAYFGLKVNASYDPA